MSIKSRHSAGKRPVQGYLDIFGLITVREDDDEYSLF